MSNVPTWLVVSLVIAVILILPPLRAWLGRMTGSFFQWGLAQAGTISFSTILWVIKRILMAHWVLVVNLLSPRSAMQLRPPSRRKGKVPGESV